MYHTALALKPDDTFCDEMLKKALNEAFQSGGAFDMSTLEKDLFGDQAAGAPGAGRYQSGPVLDERRRGNMRGGGQAAHDLFAGTGGSDILPDDEDSASITSPPLSGSSQPRYRNSSGLDASLNSMEEEEEEGDDSFDLDASVEMSNASVDMSNASVDMSNDD